MSAIKKEDRWDEGMPNYAVICADGMVPKNQLRINKMPTLLSKERRLNF